MLNKSEMKSLIIKVIMRFSLFPVFIGVITLLPAGTFNYWQVYVYTAFIFIPMIFTLLYFLKNDPQLLERRTRTKEKEKAQRIIQIAYSLLFLSAFIISGFDRRFAWSSIPPCLVLLADLVCFSGYLMVFFVFKQNSYASRVVEVDEGQEVISTGLYSIVRHPMYAGIIIMGIPIPVALGSWWALIPIALMPVTIMARILNEESVLIRELPGYREYCQKTKYRLIPFVW